MKIKIKFHLLFTELLVIGQEVQVLALVDVVVLDPRHPVVEFKIYLQNSVLTEEITNSLLKINPNLFYKTGFFLKLCQRKITNISSKNKNKFVK